MIRCFCCGSVNVMVGVTDRHGWVVYTCTSCKSWWRMIVPDEHRAHLAEIRAEEGVVVEP